MTMTTPRGPESTVVRMVANAMHIQNIEVETGWTPDEIKAVAMRNGYALDAASKRFRRAPQPKPAPVGIVRTSQTSTGAVRPSEHASTVDVPSASDIHAAPVLPETGTGAADTGLLASDPSHDRGTNRERGGEPSPSAPVLPEVPSSTAAAEELLAGVKRRKSGLTTLDLHTLDRAVDMFLPSEWAWDTYLVGTAQTGGEYRDVDVRTILEDDEFDAVFRTRKNLWGAWCFAIGTMLRTATGLPIDYQVQRRTEANAKYDGPRNPIGNGRRGFAGYGDATPFDATGQHQTPKAAAPTKRPGNYPTGPRR